jgi:alpha-D-ribose 1-methylphosphonate 5-triphosphate diphosphatase
MTMWISNVRLILPDRIIERGAVEIVAGEIAQVSEQPQPLATSADGRGLTLIPGLIDLHGDMLEREIEPRPRAYLPVEFAAHELDKRLAATGVTTAFAAVAFAWRKSDLRTQENAVRIIETLHHMKHSLLTDCRVHARFEVNNDDTVPLLDKMLRAGMVDLVSIMDHTPGQGQYSDTTRYTQFLREWLGFSDEQLAPVYSRIEQKVAQVQAEPRNWEAARRIIQTALAYGVAVAAHDDDTPQKVEEQARMGVTLSEFPVNLAAARAARDHNMHVIMGAPNAYRGESNTGNLSASDAIAAGVVDILASDYIPGAMLHVVWKLAERGLMALPAALRLVTANPADAMGMKDRGRLMPGHRADLVLVEEGPYPRVRATWRGGQLIYSDHTLPLHVASSAQVPTN